MNKLEIRPKMKQDTILLQMQEGIFIQNDTNQIVLKGKHIAHWIYTLTPYLTGEYTMNQLCQQLGSAQRELVVQLVDTLMEKKMLKNHIPESSEVLPAAVSQQFRSQIEYIDHFTDYPQAKFKAFRESAVAVIGCGESFKALAISLLRNGLEKLFLVPSTPSDEYRVVLEDEAAMLRQKGCSVSITFSDISFPTSIERLDPYDVIVYCADQGTLRDIALLNRRCMDEGRAFLAATIFAGRAMLGPFVKPHSGPCWFCAQMRLAANSDESEQALLWRNLAFPASPSALPGADLYRPVAQRIGHGLGFELFKLLSKALPSETDGGVIFQDLNTLEASTHSLEQHPLCPVCTQLDHETALQRLKAIISGGHDSNLTHLEALEKHSSWFDTRLGVFHDFSDEALEQIPLKQTTIVAGSPDPLLAGPLAIKCYSKENMRDARSSAFIKAIESYTRALPDMRTMLLSRGEEMNQAEKIVLQPHLFAHWSGVASLRANEQVAWMPAYSLFQDAIVYVPAAAVYPFSPLNASGLFEQTTAGWAVDTSYQQTLIQATVSALAYMQLCTLLRGRRTVIPIALEKLETFDSDVRFLIQSARRFARPFSLFEVVGDAPISLFIACTTDTLTEPLTAYGYGLSASKGLKQALIGLVGALQTLQNGEEPPALAKAFFSSPFSFEIVPSAAADKSHLEQPPITFEAIKMYLQERGNDLLFVNTATSDVWAQGVLISGTALIVGKNSGGTR
ncbi:hypothetical protein EPA93_45465 [Ktedonosporobacter rubrisoli]|uniref:YcaO domain-containing protein n=1 Tax=Ktedonosporobacter rubrisoli TaxID=2509675 RepID=A0A4P6K4R2_KTERU|nr:TOMM precursor leader peptide-binding protein [Ktedonosporobacter rubrisoli]QBD82830.1 hypothetical protein EPA93_45465 [Ktedonosporobacter rubrisoli]